jgi:AraC-like DNA-binding protein
MNRLQTILQPEARKALGHFSSLLNVRLGFFEPNGTEVCIGGGRPICTYCRELRKTCESECIALDRKMFAKARITETPFHYACHGGLTEAFVPVDLNGKRIGLVMVGQFRAQGQQPPPKAGALWNDYQQRPVFSEQQIEDMLCMLELMVQAFIARHLVISAETDRIQLLLDRIHDHPGRTLTVSEAAAFTARSPSSLAHLFKKLTGRNLRQYQIEVKLNEADRLLKTFPDMPIKEIAGRLGFEDPLYFSRLYKKHRGAPPSVCRQQLSLDSSFEESIIFA